MNKLKYLYFKIRNKLSFRASRGFGIHSPFVFNLITEVFKDKSEYYAFDELLEQNNDYSKSELKYMKLIYRLANNLKINSVYGNIISYSNELNLLSKLHSNIIVNDELFIDNCSEFLLLGKEDIDKFYESKSSFINLFREKEVTIVIKDMYKYDNLLSMWNEIKEESRVSIDLFNLGILFFNKKLQIGDYTVNI